ncbi:MAG: hypothetical protein NC184_05330 [Roseburia sp.]|nr:hypothetical protein [Roseburia sp.]
MSKTKTIIIIVAFVLLIGGLAGCIVALVNLTNNKPESTETGAKIILNDGSYTAMQKNAESLPDDNLVYEYYATNVMLHKADQIGFKADGQMLSVYTDPASTGIDLTDKDKALYKVLVLVTGKYDVYLKNYKSGVWTVYMTTEQVMATAIDENGRAITDGQVMPQRMTFLRSARTSENATVNVNATVTPDGVNVKSAEWNVSWNNAQSDWAKDKDIAEYLTISSNGLNATLECLQPFGEQIDLGITVTDSKNNSKSANTTVDYMKRNTFESLSYLSEQQPNGEVSATAYYVTGSFAEWDVNVNNELIQVSDTDNGWSQFKATVMLNADDEIKVVKGDKSKYFDGWELWSATADYAHVNKDSDGYGNLIIDKAGKYDITFVSDKSNEQSHQIKIVPHNDSEDSSAYVFGNSYIVTDTVIALNGLNISQSLGTVGSVPTTYTLKVGYTSEFVKAFAVDNSILTADQLAVKEATLTLDEFNTEINLMDLPNEFVNKFISGEYEFDGNVAYIEVVAIDGTVSGDNTIYFAFDLAKEIQGVEINGAVTF